MVFHAVTLVIVFGMVGVTSASRYVTSASRYQSRSSKYIQGVIPRNSTKLSKAVPMVSCVIAVCGNLRSVYVSCGAFDWSVVCGCDIP